MSTREFIRGEASLTPSLEGHVTRMGSVTTGQDRCVCVCVCVCGNKKHQQRKINLRDIRYSDWPLFGREISIRNLEILR